MRTTTPSLALFALALAACSSSSSPSSGPDASSPSDAAGTATNLDDASPSTPGTCTPAPGNAGNSKNVGAYCTQNGGQCSTYANGGVQCSIDLSPQGSNFCILIGCAKDTDCGEDACCTGQPGNPIHACVPNGCFDAGVCQGIPQ